MGILLFFFLCGYLASVFTSGMQQKAGYKLSDAFIPLKGNINMAKMIDKPVYWAILCYTPVFNFFILVTLFSDLAKSFGKDKFHEYLASMLFPFAYLPFLGFNKTDTYKGIPEKKEKKKGTIREWADAISFALIAATLIRWSTFEAYTIPTPSMESSLLVGDFLFVSKLHYGSRTPITPIQAPLTHQYLWMTGDEMKGKPGVKSYSEAIKLPYNRISGFQSVKNNDVVVFNWPADLQHTPVDLKTNYIKRCIAIAGDDIEVKNRVVYINGKKTEDPEDTQFSYDLVFKDQTQLLQLLRQASDPNGHVNLHDPSIQKFLAYTDAKVYEKTNQHILNQDGIYIIEPGIYPVRTTVSLSKKQYEKAKQLGAIFSELTLSEDRGNFILEIPISIRHQFDSSLASYKNTVLYDIERSEEKLLYSIRMNANDFEKITTQFEIDYRKEVSQSNFYLAKKAILNTNNFGPIHVPAKGETIKITPENLDLYGYVIKHFDFNNNVEITNNVLTINGEKVSEYTFKQNYYFMMGDNRNNSQDSRYWGFVPEDHIVGKASLIWFSLSNEPGNFLSRIRWNRLLNLID